MTGARVAPATGMVSLMVIEHGASSRLVSLLRPGEAVTLMGPTGVRAPIPERAQTTLFVGGRPRERGAGTGPVVGALAQYAAGKLGDIPIRLDEVTRLQVAGSNRLVRLIRDARKKELAPYLTRKPATTASTNTPMQCCLTGVWCHRPDLY